LATREKGKKLMEALVEGIRKDIEDLRQSPVPEASLRQP
jgi:creatinine amidohydrolase/Fe(II)-dependent formamide hydrolase-like protein